MYKSGSILGETVLSGNFSTFNDVPGTELLYLLALIVFSQLFWLCHFSNQTGMKEQCGNSDRVTGMLGGNLPILALICDVLLQTEEHYTLVDCCRALGASPLASVIQSEQKKLKKLNRSSPVPVGRNYP